MGPFAYAAFFMGLWKFNDFGYDMRISGHKLMGIVCYVFIVANKLVGDSYPILDLALFAAASFYFYRAMSDDNSRTSRSGIATVLVGGLLIAGAYWQPSPPAASRHKGKTREEVLAEEALKAVLKQAQQTSGGMRELEKAGP